MVFVTVVRLVPVVVRPLLESFWLSSVMPRPSRSTNNSLSAGLPTEDSLPSTATSESPVSSTASSSWSPQLADSLTEAVVRAIGNSIPAIISSIQRSRSDSSVPGVSASGAPQPLLSSASASNASTSDGVSSVASRTFTLPAFVPTFSASAGHYRLELGPPRGTYSLHFRIAQRY